MTLQRTKRRFTVHEYYQMAEAGILTEEDRVELLDGEIVEMPPIGPAHNAYVTELTHLFVERFGRRARVQVQGPVRLSENSEPQPDLALLRPRPDRYATAHPTPHDVLLIVEVADTSVEFDRRVKGLLYARSGISEYWLLDIGQAAITVYREPASDGYGASFTLRRGDRLTPNAFPDLEFRVSDILGEA